MLKRDPSCGGLVGLLIAGLSVWPRDALFPPESGRVLLQAERFTLSLLRDMAFQIVVTADRFEAHRHIGGPPWNGGVRSSIATPLGRTITQPTAGARSSLQPIPVQRVSQRCSIALHYHPKDWFLSGTSSRFVTSRAASGHGICCPLRHRPGTRWPSWQLTIWGVWKERLQHMISSLLSVTTRRSIMEDLSPPDLNGPPI